ncbi:uncharacterized protein LOC113301476 [Papaver somniferum]|uniref:uncharacterized protein LOC113301476 n=1 Tax=Papaver somniferum TaxID=3469 RepID=UPI000E703A6E|nr:uncharacterized protein LOC113301476 [Papaver somniferum]
MSEGDAHKESETDACYEDDHAKAKGKAPMDTDTETHTNPNKPTMKTSQGFDDDRWKLYVVHPQFGAFVVHEGVAFVADRFLVVWVGRFGFMSITMPANVSQFVWILVMQPWNYDAPMHFSVLDALCPTVAGIKHEVFGVKLVATQLMSWQILLIPTIQNAMANMIGDIVLAQIAQVPPRAQARTQRTLVRPSPARATRSRTRSVSQRT